MIEICDRLFAMQDKEYRDFHSKLMPNIDRERVIGVRIPDLRKYAKELAKDREKAEEFIWHLPHEYYEENNLHAFIIETYKDFDRALDAVDTFLPYVDNWATCDMMSPKVFANEPDKLLEAIKRWIASGGTYEIRYGINMLMKYFLDDRFLPEYPELVVGIVSEAYYVNMMIAWYFATALAKQYDSVIHYLEDDRLSVWNHNKIIQKAIESRRITNERKEYLRSLKR